MAAIQAIASSKTQERMVLECKNKIIAFTKEGIRIQLQWIPAHCNIHGNEKADYLAKLGSKKKQYINPTSYKSIKSHINGAVKRYVKNTWKSEAYGKQWEHKIKHNPRKQQNRSTYTAQF
jgi:hypothetical protein